jgi:hypothetical protein
VTHVAGAEPDHRDKPMALSASRLKLIWQQLDIGDRGCVAESDVSPSRSLMFCSTQPVATMAGRVRGKLTAQMLVAQYMLALLR